MSTTATALCTRCHRGTTVAVGLCRSYSLREAQIERNRRSRAERREYAASRFQKRREQEARHYQAPPGWSEPEDAA